MTTTCYYIEVVADTGNASGLTTALENVFSNRTTELPDQAQAATEVPERTGIDGNTVPAHVRQVKLINTSEDRGAAADGLLNAQENNPNVDWYEVRTHDCQHDLGSGAGTGACSANQIAEDSSGNQATSGTVPPEV